MPKLRLKYETGESYSYMTVGGNRLLLYPDEIACAVQRAMAIWDHERNIMFNEGMPLSGAPVDSSIGYLIVDRNYKIILDDGCINKIVLTRGIVRWMATLPGCKKSDITIDA